jgi:CheY-like chemotaxis protein
MHDGSTDASGRTTDLIYLLSRKVVGQPAAMQYIVPYVQMYQAGLSPTDRPAGIFLLLGPTGTGKTRTVEALAEVLHGSARQLLTIDCAEYQSDHEVAKLIGAPPGYLGHRETRPMLTSERLLEATTPSCDLALVLFDEIEKAAPALSTLLLGILDKGTLRLGDNTPVDFERTLIFLTSNLGAREMMREIQPDIGFQSGSVPLEDLTSRLETIGLAAVRKRFSPEFVNRLDVVVTYQPLDQGSLAEILDHHIAELQRHVNTRLGDGSFEIAVTPAARRLLTEKGTSPQSGARELKRTVHRLLTQPLAALVADRSISPGARVIVDRDSATESLRIEPGECRPAAAVAAAPPVVLLLDDNPHLLDWLRLGLEATGVTVMPADSAAQAAEEAARRRPDVALVDVMLPDGDGLTVALQLLRQYPRLQIIVMSGMELSADEAILCQRYDFPVLRKPFLISDLVNVLRARVLHGASSVRSVAAGSS